MSVRSILEVKGNAVETIGSATQVSAAVIQLRAKKVGALVVCDQERSVAGIISERDIIRGLAEHGDSALQMQVKDFMTSTVSLCNPDDTVAHVMQQMTEGRFRHMPVVIDGQLSGIISIGDVVKKRLTEMEHETAAMRDYIAGN